MKLVVVRHGQAVGNVEDLIMGQNDTPLTELGKHQAQDLVQRLAAYPIDIIYSSPQLRARDTVKPYADQKQLKVNIDARISEINFGSFSGKHKDTVLPVVGIEFRDLIFNNSYDFIKFGGESSAHVSERVTEFIQAMKHGPHETVLAATHGGIVNWINFIVTGRLEPLPDNVGIQEYIL